MTKPESRRVLTLGPMPPEKCAYALARYSRSPDSIAESLAWVRSHDSSKFLESFYFQYGHASIADLGHLVVCFEGVSELAATEIEDEQLWDGQARSSRYQDFSKSGYIVPEGLTPEQETLFRQTAGNLLDAYAKVHAGMIEHLAAQHPKPAEMKPDAYQRNIAARAFDVARYLLFFAIPTGVGQVVSIRTLEKQIRRLKASEYAESIALADEIAAACARPPACPWNLDGADEPVAPTLARHVDADRYAATAKSDLKRWAAQNLPASPAGHPEPVDVLRPSCVPADIVATLLYPVTDWPFRHLYDLADQWSPAMRKEVIDVAMQSRSQRDDLLANFRGNLYAFDIVTDIGAYRDLHRHRRCQQFRQAYTHRLGFAVPEALKSSGLGEIYHAALAEVTRAVESLLPAHAHYLLPFAAKSRSLFKMDFAEAEYIARLRSGVKGHFSYRDVAWRMKEKLAALEPELAALLSATPPWIEDPLKR